MNRKPVQEIQGEKSYPALSEELFILEPIHNLLNDPMTQPRIMGIKWLPSVLYPAALKELRRLEQDSDPEVREAARDRLKKKELYFRKRFFYFQNLLRQNPNGRVPKFGFALTCLRYAQYWVENEELRLYFLQKALKYFNQLIRIHSPAPKYFYHRGETYLEMGQLPLARSDFEKVIKTYPSHLGAIERLVDIYLKEGELPKIANLLRRIGTRRLPPHLSKSIRFWME